MILLLVGILLGAQDEEAAGAVAACEAVFNKTKDTTERVQAVGTMAQTQHEKVIQKLTTYMSNEDKAVKAAAVLGLTGFQSATPELKKLAARAVMTSCNAGANVKDADFKVAAMAALGTLQEESTIMAIKSHLDDKDLKVSVAALNAAVAFRTKALIEPIIDQLRDCEKTLKAGASANPVKGRTPVSSKKSPDAPPDPEEVKRDRASGLLTLIPTALQTLTGQTFTTGAEWQAWWAKNKNTFTISK